MFKDLLEIFKMILVIALWIGVYWLGLEIVKIYAKQIDYENIKTPDLISIETESMYANCGKECGKINTN